MLCNNHNKCEILGYHVGNEQLVHRLIHSGANINLVDNDEQTALHIAAANGNVKVADLLIKNGANVSSVDNYGWTALHIASENGFYY